MKRWNVRFGAGALLAAGAGVGALSFARMGTIDEYNAAIATTRARLGEQPELQEFIRFATLAASGHNAQPWRFRVGDNCIEILPDLARRTPIVDPDDHHLFVSLGCAVENLVLAAALRGRAARVRFDPEGDGKIDITFGSGSTLAPVYAEAIVDRQSTRAEYDGRSVGTSDLRTLDDAAHEPGVDHVMITDRPQLERVRDLVVTGNRAQQADAAFVAELKSWMRFNPRQALATNDGLLSAATGNPVVPTWLGGLLFGVSFRAGSENDTYARQLQSSAGVAVFVAELEDREHWMRVGRACQRFSLKATALGLRCAFINQPVEVASLRPELANLIGLPGRRPDIIMRFGYGPTLPFSPRRPVPAVLA